MPEVVQIICEDLATHSLCPMPVFALGLRQFALSERKSNLAKDFADRFRQIWAAGEIHFLYKAVGVKLVCVWYHWKAL